MSGLPDDVTEGWWGINRGVPIVHAVDALLDHLEERIDFEGPVVGGGRVGLLPLSTGLMPLDRVLGGGIWRGTVTLVEADIEAQGAALLNTVARHAPHRCLLDGPVFLAMVAGLVAGSGGVPEVSVREACMSSREWAAVTSGLRDLRDRDLSICSTGSFAALNHVIRSAGVDAVLVHDAGRFGPPIEVVPKLARLAAASNVAVLSWVNPIDDLPAWETDAVVRLGMHAYNFGGRASLVRTDPDEMFTLAQVEVDCLLGVVR